MVTHWGMSERLGPVAFRDSEDHPFLGREMAEPRRFSEHTAQVIDEEVSRLLRDASDKAVGCWKHTEKSSTAWPESSKRPRRSTKPTSRSALARRSTSNRRDAVGSLKLCAGGLFCSAHPTLHPVPFPPGIRQAEEPATSRARAALGSGTVDNVMHR